MSSPWPDLPYEDWRPTRDTLHMYTQVLGKLKLALNPPEPQWAQVPLFVTARGLTTSTIPVGLRTIDAELDLLSHILVIRSSDGDVERRPLGGDVAGFYDDVMRMLKHLGVDVRLSVLPSEVDNAIRFPEDRVHNAYVREDVERFFRTLSMVDVVMKEHHARFRGRTTFVQFFWGTFDLALTRYSGRAVEPPPGAGVIRRVGGDAEAICAGWWAGDQKVRYPAFFAYGYPSPPGVDKLPVAPHRAAWSSTSGEFLLPYDAVRSSDDPARAILEFLETTYTGLARIMRWDPALTGPPKVPA